MKEFNTTAICIPSKHYMVDLSERVKEIRKLVDAGKYFTINRGRQYGKTTTIACLASYLEPWYEVLSLDFQKISHASFKSEEAFIQAFSRQVLARGKKLPIPEDVKAELQDYISRREDRAIFDELFFTLARWCEEAEKPVVLIIDEVDTAADNQVFLDFLSQLRADYLERENDPDEKTFQAVILAGVIDVRHLKSRIRPEDAHKVNSPWNIATDFDIDMSLSEDGIKGMLDEYESDHHTGMDTSAVARQIREYTNGYPYLVSRICQLIDERSVPGWFPSLSDAWTVCGVDEAVKVILSEDNTFFESVMGKLINYPDLKSQLRRILLQGETVAYLPDDEEQKQLRMYGFVRNNHNTLAVSNRIFEMRLYNYFIGESRKNENFKQAAASAKPIFVNDDGWLDVPKIMAHFIEEHNRIYKNRTEIFLEEEGRDEMTIRQEAYKLIDTLPDESVRFVVQIIRNMSPAFFDGRVILEPLEPDNSARIKLRQISQLKEDWNGNGAASFSVQHIKIVDELLSALKYIPEVFPTGCDTIQLEFDKASGEHLEIEIPETGVSEYYYVDDAGSDRTGTVGTNADTINDLVGRFYESGL